MVRKDIWHRDQKLLGIRASGGTVDGRIEKVVGILSDSTELESKVTPRVGAKGARRAGSNG
jgi:hypothetical protein